MFMFAYFAKYFFFDVAFACSFTIGMGNCCSPSKRKRKGFSKSITSQVYRSTQGRCYYCRTHVGREKNRGKRWNIDHFIAFAENGENDIRNYVLSCGHCNHSKGKKNVYTWAKQRGYTLRCRHIVNASTGELCLTDGVSDSCETCSMHYAVLGISLDGILHHHG